MGDRGAVAVVGASGFVGQAVCLALEHRGAQVIRIRAPRLAPLPASDAVRSGELLTEQAARLSNEMGPAQAVVNAAGIAESGSGDVASLYAANGALPGVIASAARQLSARFVHVSSAAVQGRVPILDSDPACHPFSAYSRSKSLGENAARRADPSAVIYRPPGVHSADREVTRAVSRLAASRLSSVAAPGSANAAQALLLNVADAIAFLAVHPDTPPPVVSHPSEGMSTADLLRTLGGRDPLRVPEPMARAVLVVALLAGRLSPPLMANARRLEVMWFGQGQAASWLTEAGWAPVAGPDAWSELGRQVRSHGRDTHKG